MNKEYNKWLGIENKRITNKLKLLSPDQVQTLFAGGLSFGTAGLRGIMDLGTSRLNDINICKLANAILCYLNKKKQDKVVIGYDTRNNSKSFAKIFAKVLANGGINVVLSKGFIPTPLLI